MSWLVMAFVSLSGGSLTSQDLERSRYDLLLRGGNTRYEGESWVGWTPDGRGFIVAGKNALGQTQLMTRDARTGAITPLVTAGYDSVLRRELGIFGINTSPDRSPIDSWQSVPSIGSVFLRSGSRSFLFDLTTHRLREMMVPATGGEPAQSRPTFSRGLKKIAFARAHDIVIRDPFDGSERRLTIDGDSGVVNGGPPADIASPFVQSDEIRWSPDGRRLAFIRFDQRAVDRFPRTKYVGSQAHVVWQYYPTPGRPIAKAFVLVADVASGEIRAIGPELGENGYIFDVGWSPDGKFVHFTTMDRAQKRAALIIADCETGELRTLIQDTSSVYVNRPPPPRWTPDGRHVLWVSERDTSRAIYRYSTTGRLEQVMRRSSVEVTDLIAIDSAQTWCYFTATTNRGLERHLYRAALRDTVIQRLTPAAGVHDVELNPTVTYFVDKYSNVSSPMRKDLRTTDGRFVRTLGVTQTARIDSLKLLPPLFVEVDAADGTTPLVGALYRPATFDATARYPLLVYVYGGPRGTLVRNEYSHEAMAQRLAQLGFVVWTLDNRGSGGRGKRFEEVLAGRLGELEVADQVAGVEALLKRFSFLDEKRIGLFGGSYGGYVVIMAMERNPGLFTAGAAVSPVTDWRLFEASYSERYLGPPSIRSAEYDSASVIPRLSAIQGELFIIHGMLDGTVHPIHTLLLFEEAARLGRNVKGIMLPNWEHGPTGAMEEVAAVNFLVDALMPLRSRRGGEHD